MKSAIMSLTTLLLCAGCSATLSETRADNLTIPDVRIYTDAEYDRAGQEMTAQCGNVPILCRMIGHYGVMRDQARAARGQSVDITR